MAELKINEIAEVHRHVIAAERIWLTADDKLVAEGDPDATQLFASEGKRIPRAEAIRYGLVKQSKEEKQEEAAAKAEAGAAVVESSVDEVLAAVGGDKARAEEALAAEKAKPAKERRKTLVEGLQAVLAVEES